MFDRVFRRELPDMEQWPDSLIKEAIRCKVQFEVLIPAQGTVTGYLVDADKHARLVRVHITHDPRDRLSDVEYLSDMRRIGGIPYPAQNFSLMQQRRPIMAPAAAPANLAGERDTVREAARRLMAATGRPMAKRENVQRILRLRDS